MISIASAGDIDAIIIKPIAAKIRLIIFVRENFILDILTVLFYIGFVDETPVSMGEQQKELF